MPSTAAQLYGLRAQLLALRDLVLTTHERVITMSEAIDQIKAQQAALVAAADDARADAATIRQLVTSAVTMLQDQAAAIAALREQVANGSGVTSADLIAIQDANAAILATFAEANAERDAAAADLAGGVAPA